MIKRDIIIAVDGHSSTGKSTFAKAIAQKYGLIYVDTGALYRGVTLASVRGGITTFNDPSDIERLEILMSKTELTFKPTGEGGASELWLGDENIEREIRSLEISGKVSIYASLPSVRGYVDSILKGYGVRRGVVMDGRDIGTVVFPDADLKIFMTADARIRAQRRCNEMTLRGDEADFEEVLKNVNERDFMDENRESAPLRRADDALFLDNSYMTHEDQMVWIEKIISQKWG